MAGEGAARPRDIFHLGPLEVTDKSANPAPLGLMGFGMTTVLLNMANAGWFPVDTVILSMGIFYGGIAQIIAG
jgi:succinate-acetate transporter protein